MHTITITTEELAFLRSQMQLTAMNERGHAADLAAIIVDRIDGERQREAQFADHLAAQFADLFPAGGRE